MLASRRTCACAIVGCPKFLQKGPRKAFQPDSGSLIPRLCRADLGWILYFGLANLRKIAGEILSELLQRFFSCEFSALFLKACTPPPPKQNSLLAFLSTNNFRCLNPKCFHADFQVGGDQWFVVGFGAAFRFRPRTLRIVPSFLFITSIF